MQSCLIVIGCYDVFEGNKSIGLFIVIANCLLITTNIRTLINYEDKP